MTKVLTNTSDVSPSTGNLSPDGKKELNPAFHQISAEKFLACMKNSGKVTLHSDPDTGEPSYLQCICEVLTSDNEKITKIVGIGDPVTIKTLLTGSDPSNHDSSKSPSPIESSTKNNDEVDDVPMEPDDGPMEPSLNDEPNEDTDYGFGGEEEKKKKHPLADTPGVPFAVE